MWVPLKNMNSIGEMVEIKRAFRTLESTFEIDTFLDNFDTIDELCSWLSHIIEVKYFRVSPLNVCSELKAYFNQPFNKEGMDYIFDNVFISWMTSLENYGFILHRIQQLVGVIPKAVNFIICKNVDRLPQFSTDSNKSEIL